MFVDLQILFNANGANNANCAKTFTFLKFALKSIAIALSHNYDLVFATSTPLTAGIPGIFALAQKQKVSLVNAPGNGIADDKAIYPYVPDNL